MNKLDFGPLEAIGKRTGGLFRRYGAVLFFLLFALVYAYVIMQINSYSNVQVDPSSAASQAKAASVQRIDPSDVERLESLKDNSVNVQALFEQNRTNPFQE